MKNLIADGVTLRPDWKGLGYIKLIADIMKEDTIKDVENGLLDAVSASFNSPGHAYCFICGKNWAQGDQCDHEWGETYEDDDGNEWPMMLIPALHLYDEVSFVVKDADPLTAVSIADSKDDGLKLKYNDSWINNLDEFDATYQFSDSFEEENMAKPKKDPKLSDEAKAVLEQLKSIEPELEEEKLVDFATKISNLKKDGKYPNQDAADITEETAVQYAYDFLKNEDQEIDADAIYSDMEKEFELLVEEKILTEDQVKDAKLTAEQRKKLSKSTFCGPNKSFPVPDCAHVTAAKRLIDRYKGPGDKSAILACVNKKAKALGCESSDSVKGDNTNEIKFVMPTCDAMNVASNEEVIDLYNKAEAECISRKLKLDRPCAKCADAEAETKKAQDSYKELEEKLKDAENTLTVLREELRFQHADYMSQVDEFIKLEEEFSAYKEEKLAILGTLGGKYKSINDATSSLKEKGIDSLEESIMDCFDVDKILEKVNNGMTNHPTGDQPLSNPAETDGDAPINDIEKLDYQGKLAIQTLKDFIAEDKVEEAEEFFNRMKAREIIPKEFEFKTFSAAEKKN
jgi:uncharacterized protein YacL (UPF0231 family)